LAFDRQALSSWFTGLNPDKVVHAINCGSNEEFVDLLGVTYSPDFGFTGGQTSEAGSEIQWALSNSEIYHSERWGSFKYQLPIPTDDAQYTLILKFSEIYFQEPGQKVFNIKVGSQVAVRDLDIFSKLLSRGIPYDEFVDIRVKGGKVTVNGQESSDALKNGKLQIDFVQGKADNPKINGIVLVQGGKENTHYNAFKNYLKALEDLKQ
jgi:hypothetical protein